MAKTIACTDLFPGCGFKAQADTEEELLKKAAAHAAEAHGIATLDSATVAKVKSCVREVK